MIAAPNAGVKDAKMPSNEPGAIVFRGQYQTDKEWGCYEHMNAIPGMHGRSTIIRMGVRDSWFRIPLILTKEQVVKIVSALS